jgi:DNA-binding MarR family transcriptional regulator
MVRDPDNTPDLCNCLALRQAARHVTQFYDRCLAPTGLRATQYSVLSKLRRKGAMTINTLAEEMVMDRTTLGRNVQPLEREGLIVVRQGFADRRSKELDLTEAGIRRLRLAKKAWAQAQARFEGVFGDARATRLRATLREVAATDLAASPHGGSSTSTADELAD